MKRIFFSVLATLTIVACKTDDKKMKDSPVIPQQIDAASRDSANFTSIVWLDSTTIDIGKVKQGAVVEVAFRFKNGGDKQLVIEKVEAGCGCTVTEKPERPIPPGGEDVIKGKFNSAGQAIAPHTKSMYVSANTNGSPLTLTFKVEVTEDK